MTAVLLVEDDPDSREALAALLEMSGRVVRSAGNGREAIEQLEKGLRPSVILLDLMMPVMNGWEFLEARARGPAWAAIPVIVLSAAAIDGKISSLGVPYLRKPIDPDALERMLAAYV